MRETTSDFLRLGRQHRQLFQCGDRGFQIARGDHAVDLGKDILNVFLDLIENPRYLRARRIQALRLTPFFRGARPVSAFRFGERRRDERGGSLAPLLSRARDFERR